MILARRRAVWRNRLEDLVSDALPAVDSTARGSRAETREPPAVR
jgi:hypothetical protein